jgi:hypothetical protein
MITVLAITAATPHLPPLATNEELARIGDTAGVSLRTLTDATKQRVAHRLSLEAFDAVLIIAHGLRGYVLLNDGPMDPHWLAAQLAGRQVQLAIIATCQSSQHPESLHATVSFRGVLPANQIDTITMDTDVSDRAALEYDVALLQGLASGSPLRMAHEAAVAAAWPVEKQAAAVLTPRDGKRTSKQEPSTTTLATMDKLDGKVDQLLENVHDLDKRLSRLEDRFGRLENETAQMRRDLEQATTPAPIYSRVYLAGGAVAMTVVIVLLLIVTWRLL